MSAIFPASNVGKQNNTINTDRIFNLTQFELQIPGFLNSTGREIAENLLNQIKRKMEVAGYSRKIIDGTTIENFQITPDGFLEFDISSQYDTDKGFDVATAREKGTINHDLPKVEGRTYSWIQDGKRVYSKGHKVSGIPASNIITDTLLEQTRNSQNELNSNIDNFFGQIMNQG